MALNYCGLKWMVHPWKCSRPGWMGFGIIWSGGIVPAHGWNQVAFKGPFQPKPGCGSMIILILRELIRTRFVLECSGHQGIVHGSSKSFNSSHHGEDSLLPGTDKFLEEELIAANWQLPINDELHAQP